MNTVGWSCLFLAAAVGLCSAAAGAASPRIIGLPRSQIADTPWRVPTPNLPAEKNCGGSPEGPLRQKIPSIDYWSSFRTICSWVLACARAAMPVCSRTWNLDMLATTCPMFASSMPLSEEERFCEVLFMTWTAAFI